MTAKSTRALTECIEALLAQGDPWTAVGERQLTELLVELAPTGQGRAHLARYLRTTTARVADDADPHMPRQVQRLLRTMRDRGWSSPWKWCNG